MEEIGVGGLSGAIIRLIPTFLKMLSDHLERRHEINMLRLSADIAREQVDARLAGDPGDPFSPVSAQAALVKTGYIVADRISSLIRPVQVIWLFAIYTAFMARALITGEPFNDFDRWMLATVTSYWLTGRALDKHGRH